MTALEAGLLTCGSSYWPTPSQRLPRQWSILLAFVPDHSGASVRELHPLPSSSTSRATTAMIKSQLSCRMMDIKRILACPAVVRDTVRSPRAPPDQPPVLERGTRHVAVAERLARTHTGVPSFSLSSASARLQRTDRDPLSPTTPPHRGTALSHPRPRWRCHEQWSLAQRRVSVDPGAAR